MQARLDGKWVGFLKQPKTCARWAWISLFFFFKINFKASELSLKFGSAEGVGKKLVNSLLTN